MLTGYTHITLVVDRSGSMAPIRTDAEGAVNQFVTDQKAVPGQATLKLIEFDAPGNGADWYHVVHDSDIQGAPSYRLEPRGSTALLDAIGRAIIETGNFLANKTEDQRPEHVVFVVQTDGQENSSKEHTLEAISAAIKKQTDIYKWQFLFLGMGPDTFAQGHAMGFQNVTRSADSGDAYAATYGVASSAVSGLRTNSTRDLSATNVQVDEQGNVK